MSGLIPCERETVLGHISLVLRVNIVKGIEGYKFGDGLLLKGVVLKKIGRSACLVWLFGAREGGAVKFWVCFIGFDFLYLECKLVLGI